MSLQFYTETADLSLPTPFWNVPIYILEAAIIHSGGWKLSWVWLIEKGGSQKGGTLAFLSNWFPYHWTKLDYKLNSHWILNCNPVIHYKNEIRKTLLFVILFFFRSILVIFCKLAGWSGQGARLIYCPEKYISDFTTQPHRPPPPSQADWPPTKPLLRVKFGPIFRRFCHFWPCIFGQVCSTTAKIGSKSAPLRGVAECVWSCGGGVCGWSSGHKNTFW